MHIGNARTALFNWMYARKTGGAFVLRIEDTDRERSSTAYETALLENLKWLGIDWDEGPDVGGSFGPYRQSSRLEIYREHARVLLEKGIAYRCYCSPEELAERRKATRADGRRAGYDNRCRGLSDAQEEAFQAEGRRPALRFVVPEKEVVVEDMVRGTCRFDSRLLGDFVILKADGMPTYHFAVVVDDALMGITHVIRGEGHLPNTPLHVLLFGALGKPVPAFAHMSHTVSDTGKLSKRSGALSIRHYQSEGYLPGAVANYIALLGWHPRRREETFGIRDVVGDFDVHDLSKASARHDEAKMNFIAGWHLRETAPAELVRLMKPFLTDEKVRATDDRKLEEIVLATRLNAHTLKELAQLAERYFADGPLRPEVRAALADQSSQAVLKAVVQELEASDTFSPEVFGQLMKAVSKKLGIKGKPLYHPVRLALTASDEGPELAALVTIYGKEEVTGRIRNAIM